MVPILKKILVKIVNIDLIVISDDFKDINLRERLEILGIAAGRVFEPIKALEAVKIIDKKRMRKVNL